MPRRRTRRVLRELQHAARPSAAVPVGLPGLALLGRGERQADERTQRAKHGEVLIARGRVPARGVGVSGALQLATATL
jgi:hypothetical protein